MNPAVALIDHALGIDWAALAPAERTATLDLLDDTLCVGVAGARAAHAAAVLAVARGWGEGGHCGVLGRPGTALPAGSAAFVTAFQIHGQEYDCVHEAAVLHPLASVVAALLAEAARGAPPDGATLLAAVVAGVDIAVALGLAATGPLTFFRPATAGIFGAVTALARLRNLPRAVALDAVGHALAFASGTMQAHVEGRPALPLQVGNAARGALAAVDFARAGIPGVAQPIDGAFGYLALFERASDPAVFVDLARSRITEVSLKPFPTGRAAHGGIVAVQTMMRNHGLTAATLDSLDYRAPPLIARLVGRSAVAGMEPGYARLCLPWLIAVTLTRGTVGLGAFAAETRSDPALLALAARVTVTADDNPDLAAFVPARALARRRDGSRIEVPVSALLGAPEAWPTDTQREAKARHCLAFAGLADRREALRQAVATLGDVPDALAALAATGVI